MRGLVATAALALALGQPQEGYAVRYAPGVMERVAADRDIAPQTCMVAWTQAIDADIGRAWLRIEGPAGALDCLVVDLPHPRDRPALIKRGILVELGYDNRWICGARWTGRARDCRVRAWRR